MSSQLALTIRAKKLAVLIRDAREAVGKSKKESGGALGISSNAYGSIEDGTRSPTLPQLELLSYLFSVPITHFWADEMKSLEPSLIDELNTDEAFDLRNRAIGRVLGEARDKSNFTLVQIQEATAISPSRLRKYEAGESGVPVPELESLLRLYDIQRQDLIDAETEIGRWIIEQRTMGNFLEMPLHLQEFASLPVNQPYLEIAIRLSKLSADDLRNIAEILLEITI